MFKELLIWDFQDEKRLQRWIDTRILTKLWSSWRRSSLFSINLIEKKKLNQELVKYLEVD